MGVEEQLLERGMCMCKFSEIALTARLAAQLWYARPCRGTAAFACASMICAMHMY